MCKHWLTNTLTVGLSDRIKQNYSKKGVKWKLRASRLPNKSGPLGCAIIGPESEEISRFVKAARKKNPKILFSDENIFNVKESYNKQRWDVRPR